MLAVDTETTGLTFFDEAFGGSTADASGSHWAEFPKDQDAFRESLRDRILVFHNAKFDIQKLQLAGVLDRADRPEFHDTEALAHLLDENRPKKLKTLAKDLLGLETDEKTALDAYCRKKSNGIDKNKDGYSKVPRDILVPYAVKDAEYTWALFELLWPEFVRDSELRRLYDLERQLMWVLLEMEWAGLQVDLEYAQEISRDYGKRVMLGEMACIDLSGREDFNPNSPDQLCAYFNDKGIHSDKLTKKAKKESFDASVLKTLEDPMAKALLELRAVDKIHGTYLLPLLEEQRDLILHPNFRQHGAKTGRMSSGKAED